MPNSSDIWRKQWMLGAQRALMGLFRRVCASLTSKILALAFTATVLTALLVTAVSIHSIHGFLSGQLNQQFPAVLSRTHERLNLWYSQVRLDIETFSRSQTLQDGLGTLQRAPKGRKARRAREEVEQFLAYVLQRFEQYHALFVTAPDGETLLWVGPVRHIPDRMRAKISALQASRVGDMKMLGGRRIQIASAPVKRGNRRLASLHAVLDLEALDGLFHGEDVGPDGELFLVGMDRKYLTETATRKIGEPYGQSVALNDRVPAKVTDYVSATGQRIVSAVIPFSQFHWAIVIERPYDAAFAPIFRLIGRVLLLDLAIVTLFGFIALRIAKSIARPVKMLSDGAERIAHGETEIQIPVLDRDGEIGELTEVFNLMAARLHEHELSVQVKYHELEVRVITDELTGLHNRRYFKDQLPLEIKRADRSRQLLALLMIDIDDFKRLNDSYGHAAGDDALHTVAEVMYSQIRDTDMLVRYGGEEFALLTLQGSLEGAAVLAEKVREAVEAVPIHVQLNGETHAVHITVSIGIAQYLDDEKAFFNAADGALYTAKAQGKNRVCVDSG